MEIQTRIPYRDQEIDEAKQHIKKIRKDLEDLGKIKNEIEVNKIEEVINELNDIIQKLPEKIPDSDIISQHVNEIFKFLDACSSRVQLVVEIETNLGHMATNIHLIGVLQKIIKNPGRKSLAPRGKIWKNLKACFPRFKGFDLDVYSWGVKRPFQKADSFCVKFRPHLYTDSTYESVATYGKEIIPALEAFEPILKAFVGYEVEKYRVEEHYWTWIMEKESMLLCEFSWRTFDEEYDPSR